MKIMKVFHSADLHYSPKSLKDIDRAFHEAITSAISRECDLAVIAGDSFDSTMGIHEPAFVAYFKRVRELANAMPIMILQGTYSHDRPGALASLADLGSITRYPIWVAEEPERKALITTPNGITWDDGEDTYWDESLIMAYVHALPSLNKADPAIMEQGAATWVRRNLMRWGKANTLVREQGIPTILITHGTVIGSITESNFAMISPDHEFDLETLCVAECDAVFLGHIHKQQSWIERTPSDAPCRIAYPGSLVHLVYGHIDPVGWLYWTIESGRADFEFIEVQGHRRIDVAFDGTPDMKQLAEISAEIREDDRVRIRWNIDEDHAHAINKDAIRTLFSHASEIKLEGTINPIQSVRTSGIGKIHLKDRIARWAETTGDTDKVQILCERLEMIQCEEPGEIAKRFVINGDQSHE